MALTFDEALAAIKKTKVDNNYLVVRFGYSCTFVFPYAEGMKFVGALDKAEQLTEDYLKPPRIGAIKRDDLQISVMSREEYENYKTANMLGLPLSEIVTARKTEQQKHWPKPPEETKE